MEQADEGASTLRDLLCFSLRAASSEGAGKDNYVIWRVMSVSVKALRGVKTSRL